MVLGERLNGIQEVSGSIPLYLHHRNGLKGRFQAVFVRFSIRQEIIDILSHSVISGLERAFSALFAVHLQ